VITQCQEIMAYTRQRCRNKTYAITELNATEDAEDLHLCRLHFSIRLNEPLFRQLKSWPVNSNDINNMQLLYDLHDRSKP
jgi:hypothetical protein